MSKATFTFGRFNPPTESGHGKLVSAVQDHAEETGGRHYIFPSHSQDAKKNPLTHKEKVGAMNRLFPNANIVSHGKVRTAIDAMKHLEKQGHTHVTMVVGSDRVDNFQSLLNKYRKKEYPGIKKVNVVSAGHRDPDAEGEEGESASKHRELVATGKREEFISKYSDPKLGAHIHDKVKAGMQMESVSPVGIFLLGGPGSGKDYVLKNIFSRFDLTEVQADQLLTGRANELIENKQNIVINGVADIRKIEEAQAILEGYEFDYVYVTVTNKVSRMRNEGRENPLPENKRLEKWYKSEQIKEHLNCFVFNNSINLNESGEIEKVLFAGQIEKLLERLVDQGLTILETPEPKTFTIIKEKYFPPVAKHKSGLPKKYVGKLSDSTAAARKAHWKKMGKLSDSDPRAYKPAPGDATSKTKPSKHTIAVRKMMGEEPENLPTKLRRASRSGNITAVTQKRELNDAERMAFEKAKNAIATSKVQESADSSLAAKAEKSGVSVGTLRKVYKRGVAAWNSGHRPGTTPQQWGHARVNSYINKGKTYHTADKDLREENLDELFEMQLVGTDEYRKHAIAMTPGQGEPLDAFPVKSPNKKPVAVVAKPGKSIVSQYTEHTECGTPNCCGECDGASGAQNESNVPRSFRAIRETSKKEEVDVTPELNVTKAKNVKNRPQHYNSTLQGIPVAPRFSAFEEKEPKKDFMPTPKQVTRVLPQGTKVVDGVPQHDVPKGYKRVRDFGAGYKLVKEDLTLEEAVSYHLENKISFTENVFRPGSEMFFNMISEAKRLYAEGKYEPKDEWERDMLESNIGEIAEFGGQQVVLDYPIEEGLEECWSGYTQRGMKKKGDKMVPNCVPVNEEDKTDGKGIGKPWQEGGGGAVYVKVGDSVRKVSFSKSGMKKKYMDPAATRSFVARHRCLTNKDKTSSSYWACRWPRFFSNSGKIWW